MSEVVKAVEQPLFVKKTHELSGLLKAVERGSKDAVDLIVDTMNETDETKVSLKVRLDLAKFLVDAQVKISDTISKDQLVRQVAEIKAKGLSTPLELQPGEKKRLPPTTDFNTIQEVR
jgi:hypothetical protein